MVIFQIKIFHEINFFLIIIYILLQFKTVYWFSPENSMDHWHSECIAICQWTTTMHCNWPQFNWVKEGNNTAGGQWSITLCFDKVFTSQHVTSVYCNLNMATYENIFTACICSTMGGYVFTLFTICGGGVPTFRGGRGYLLRSGWGGTYFPGGGGYLLSGTYSGLGRGVPTQVWMVGE